jgi:uncharacterized iron-regulated membrane protein
MEQNTSFSGASKQEELPNHLPVLILGILSIVTCCCYGIVGMALSGIALYLASSSNNLYLANPEKYTAGSYKNLKTGKLCAIIGLALSALYFLYVIVVFFIYGMTALSTMPWDQF